MLLWNDIGGIGKQATPKASPHRALDIQILDPKIMFDFLLFTFI